MAVDQTLIYNLALTAIGSTGSVDIYSEHSPEADICNLWYEQVRDQVQRAAPWSCLKGAFRLPLKSARDNDNPWQSNDPTPGWLYAHGLPSDFLWPRYLSDWTPFERATLTDWTQVIVSNNPNPLLIYTRRSTDPSQWDVDLQQAIAFGLGAHICKRVTGSTSGVQVAFSLANDKIMVARANDANIAGWQAESTPEWIQARGSVYDAPYSRFIFPSADFRVAGFNNVS